MSKGRNRTGALRRGGGDFGADGKNMQRWRFKIGLQSGITLELTTCDEQIALSIPLTRD